ncbi:MAG TPA: D-2-hydroxyacid dehydrogenase family protein [Burkholderiaceae bacterium]
MKIVILDDYQDAVRALDCIALLNQFELKVHTNSVRGLGQLAVRLQPYDVLVLIRERTALPRALLARLPNLKLIAQVGKAGAHLDAAAATERGIAIAESGSEPRATAELTWALILAAQRKLAPYARNLKDGMWQTASTVPQFNGLGATVHGKTLGIWGYGKIGALVAGYGRAFGMDVLVWGGESSRARAAADGYRAADSRVQLFEQADVLSLHLRLAESTTGIVGSEDLARMRPHALLVNTARAQLIAPGALEAALRAGRPGMAALDVFEQEPLPADDVLLKMPHVLATPHLGYVTRDSYEALFAEVFANIVAFAEGRPRNIANPAVLQALPPV